jgi:hypothetical protein
MCKLRERYCSSTYTSRGAGSVLAHFPSHGALCIVTKNKEAAACCLSYFRTYVCTTALSSTITHVPSAVRVSRLTDRVGSLIETLGIGRSAETTILRYCVQRQFGKWVRSYFFFFSVIQYVLGSIALDQKASVESQTKSFDAHREQEQLHFLPVNDDDVVVCFVPDDTSMKSCAGAIAQKMYDISMEEVHSHAAALLAHTHTHTGQ